MGKEDNEDKEDVFFDAAGDKATLKKYQDAAREAEKTVIATSTSKVATPFIENLRTKAKQEAWALVEKGMRSEPTRMNTSGVAGTRLHQDGPSRTS